MKRGTARLSASKRAKPETPGAGCPAPSALPDTSTVSRGGGSKEGKEPPHPALTRHAPSPSPVALWSYGQFPCRGKGNSGAAIGRCWKGPDRSLTGGVCGRSEEGGWMQKEEYGDALGGHSVLLDWAYSCLKTHRWKNPIIIQPKFPHENERFNFTDSCHVFNDILRMNLLNFV